MIGFPTCRALPCLALALLASVATPNAANAAASYDNCTGFIASLPATIATQGTWCLDKDLSTAIDSGNAITISANNVTLDCNDFKIGGLAAGPDTDTYGVRVAEVLNATIRNCNIRGFYAAVFVVLGGGHMVEHSRFDGNAAYGLYVTSPDSTVRNVRVFDTGGATDSVNFAVGIYVGNGVDVLDSTVSGVWVAMDNANVYGIYAGANGDGSIGGNRIRGLVAGAPGDPHGIQVIGSARTVVRDNIVQGTEVGLAGGIGIFCSSNAATARGNTITGYETGIANCLSSSNHVNPN